MIIILAVVIAVMVSVIMINNYNKLWYVRTRILTTVIDIAYTWKTQLDRSNWSANEGEVVKPLVKRFSTQVKEGVCGSPLLHCRLSVILLDQEALLEAAGRMRREYKLCQCQWVSMLLNMGFNT